MPVSADPRLAPPILFDPAGTVPGLKHLLRELQRKYGSAGALVIAGQGNGWTHLNLGPAEASGWPIPVCGGVFPAIIHGNRLVKRGTLVVGLSDPDLQVVTAPNLDQLGLFEAPTIRARGEVFFAVADGLAPGIQRLVEELQYQVGARGTVLGCGSGTDAFDRSPSVITPQGLLANAGVVCRFQARTHVGVGHGWEVVSEPIRVTEAAGTRVLTLDHRPAFHVYREVLEAELGQTRIEEDFAQVAQRFPVGMVRLGQEVIVRDPIDRGDDHSMVFVGEVPEGSFIRILRGDPDKLIAAASGLRDRINANRGAKPGRDALLLMDCVTRSIFLGDRMEEEIAAIARADLLVGMLTVGEIAHPPGHRVEFLNKSSVVARIGL